MTFLYNCRHSGDLYRITKFDSDMNVVDGSSYLTDGRECDCPAGVRPTCRHREMLPKFIARGHVGDEWFFDFDRGGWVQMGDEFAEPAPEMAGPAPPLELQAKPDPSTEAEPMPPLPEGFTMMTLDDPLAVHNAIAKAVGEPEAMISERPKGVFIRRRL